MKPPKKNRRDWKLNGQAIAHSRPTMIPKLPGRSFWLRTTVSQNCTTPRAPSLTMTESYRPIFAKSLDPFYTMISRLCQPNLYWTLMSRDSHVQAIPVSFLILGSTQVCAVTSESFMNTAEWYILMDGSTIKLNDGPEWE